ncbi:hypothetical protein [Piscinibacter sakaiensis]|uniref:hypothetical protein n=1 Tax=Piscinibacter sakaiensis TaxID=1547922 RepID=UPI003AAF1087
MNAGFGPIFQQMLQFQQAQWLGLLSWQQSMLAMQSDLYDQWLSRCADAARLDD